jgi:hypothetical protein
MFLIGHSIMCVVISVMAYATVRKHFVIDRRQYFIMLFISTFAALGYMVAFAYVVATGSRAFTRSAVSENSIIAFLQGLLDLLSTISRNPFSFFFAVVMNFILLYFLFSINLCSLYLVELAKALEQRRTGGRDANEVELSAHHQGRKI